MRRARRTKRRSFVTSRTIRLASSIVLSEKFVFSSEKSRSEESVSKSSLFSESSNHAIKRHLADSFRIVLATQRVRFLLSEASSRLESSTATLRREASTTLAMRSVVIFVMSNNRIVRRKSPRLSVLLSTFTIVLAWVAWTFLAKKREF